MKTSRLVTLAILFALGALAAIPMQAQKAQSFELYPYDDTDSLIDTVTNTDTTWFNIPRNPSEMGTLVVTIITHDTITGANAGTATIQYQTHPVNDSPGVWQTTGVTGNMVAGTIGANGIGGALTLTAVNCVGYAHRVYILSTGTHTTGIKVTARWVPGAIPGVLPYATS